MRVLWFLVPTVLSTWSPGALSGSTYDAVLKSRLCNERETQQLDCNYRIADDFWLSIAAVGASNATVHFMASSIEGSYYASFLTESSCVMIIQGKRRSKVGDFSDLAYVSPRNGKVYQNVADCESGR